MTDSTDPEKKVEDEGKEPEAKAETAEVSTVPKKALDEARAKAKAKDDRIAELEAELKKNREAKPAEASGKPGVEKAERSGSDVDELKKELLDLKRAGLRRDMRAEMGLDSDQADAVMGVLDQNPGLNTSEALAIARARHADKFAAESQGGGGFNPSVHGSLRPSAGQPHGGKSELDEWNETVKEAEKLPDTASRERYGNHLAGHLLRKTMGVPSKPRPPG